MQEAAILHLPNHSSIPQRNVFAGQDGFCKSALRASIVVENDLLTGILSSGLQFKPQALDTILVSAPASGQDMLGRAIACLIADAPHAVASNHKGKDWTVPWIESKYFSPDDSYRCFSTTRRVFRTQLAHTMMNPTSRVNRQAKFVCLVRNPLDLRAAFFKYLRECYLVPSDPEPDFEFDDFFPMADAFLQVPVSLCETGQQRVDSYEQFILDWTSSPSPANVYVCYYEALVSQPKDELERLAKFLNVPFAPEAVGLVEADRMEGLGASLYQSAASIRHLYTLWEMKFAGQGKHRRTYEGLFEHERKLAYPFPQRVLPKDVEPVAQPTLSSLAKPFVKHVTKVLADRLDSARASARLAMGGAGGKDQALEGSFTEEDWAKLVKSNLSAPTTGAVQVVEEEGEEDEEENEQEQAMREEALLVRMSLRQQGVSEHIVKTVAVRVDSLSEML